MAVAVAVEPGLSRNTCGRHPEVRAALAARLLKEEHRIYPQALGELARSLRGPGGCERQVASPPAR